MAKKLAVLMSIICIGLAAFVVNIKLAEDDKGPEITFSAEDVVYDISMTDEDLLAGVMAMDEKDGNVSDSLTIEDIYSVSDEDVVIVYVAKDASNNITKAKRMLKGSTKTEEIAEDVEDIEDVVSEDISEDNNIPENDDVILGEPETADPVEPGTDSLGVENAIVGIGAESEAEKAREEQEAIADGMGAGYPRLYLTDYWIEVPVGTTIDAMSYIKDIVDESENFFDLSKKVQIYDANGNQPGVNISFPASGTYEYKFFVVDRQGNTSNSAKLIVVAK